MEPLCSYRPVAGPSFIASMPSRASWLQARVRNAVTEYRRGPWLTWPHRSIISRYAAGHSSLYRCSTMPCSSQGSPGDRQRKTSSYTPSLAPIPPPRVLDEILWRRRSGISLGTPLATSPPLYADEIERSMLLVKHVLCQKLRRPCASAVAFAHRGVDHS